MEKISILNIDPEYLGKGRIISKTNASCIRLLESVNASMVLNRAIAKQDMGVFNNTNETVVFKRPIPWLN